MNTGKFSIPVSYREDGANKKSLTEKISFEIHEDELLIRIDHAQQISLCLTFKPEEAFLIRDSLANICENLPGWDEDEEEEEALE